MAMNGVVYLLHFEKKISDHHSTQHYTGWALDLHARIAEHRAGRGARLTQVAVERGIRFKWCGPGSARGSSSGRSKTVRPARACVQYAMSYTAPTYRT
jgi:hypothetical protein